MLIFPTAIFVFTYTHCTCYARYSSLNKPYVRTRLYNLDADGKDIRMDLKEPVLSAHTGFICHRMGTDDCCKQAR